MCVFPEQVRPTDGGLQLRSRSSFLCSTGNVLFCIISSLKTTVCIFLFDSTLYLCG